MGLHHEHDSGKVTPVVNANLGKDQVADYATRKGIAVAKAKTWFAPYLGF